MSISLYRKYRPQDFASVVGQKSAVSILTNALTKNITGHAYLFSGSRGCGKTSIARIFAKALNCLNPNSCEPCGKCKNCIDITAGESLDVVEIDGASNNGVENIRNLRENINLAPFSSKHKIYIIDEVHMLSQGAFNALLKTLEEPPEYVIFIMATTEPYKVPVTIRSRCQHIPFHSISTEDICSRLEYVCSAEGVKADTEALYEISRQADGALRDGLSLLEQVISAGEITLANVEALLGAGSRSAFERVVSALRADPAQGYLALKAMFDGGASPVRVFEELFSLVRNMWLVSRWKGMLESLGLSKSERRFLSDEVPNWKPDSLHYLLDRILQALTKARQGMRTDILLGSFMFSLAKPPANLSQPAISAQPVVSSQPAISSPSAIYSQPAVSAQVPQQQTQAPEFDRELKHELLTIAHQENFLVYCALLDVRPLRGDKQLFLYCDHAYCYDRLRLESNAVALTSMFGGKFGKVILRHRGEDNFECPTVTDYRPKITQEDTSAEPNHTPAKEHEPALEHEPAAKEYEPVPETQHDKNTSGINSVRYKLGMLGSKPEILLRVRVSQQQNDSIPAGDNEDDEGGYI